MQPWVLLFLSLEVSGLGAVVINHVDENSCKRASAYYGGEEFIESILPFELPSTDSVQKFHSHDFRVEIEHCMTTKDESKVHSYAFHVFYKGYYLTTVALYDMEQLEKKGVSTDTLEIVKNSIRVMTPSSALVRELALELEVYFLVDGSMCERHTWFLRSGERYQKRKAAAFDKNKCNAMFQINY